MPAESLPNTNRLLAVLDTADEADAAVEALARAGVPAAEMAVLHGGDGAARLAQRNRPGGGWARAMRLLSFIAADQAVDLTWYEAALTEGRAVVVVHAPEADRRSAAIEALRRSGAHFMNHYGRFATEDIAPWRGKPPSIPWTHHR